MTSMPASRSARAMIFAPRSCPSRPGLATTTRIFWVALGADIERGRRDSMPADDDGAPKGPADGNVCARRLRDLERHLHRGRVDPAEDRVGPLRVELLRHGAPRP